jgi:hypothetical protein
VPSTLWSFTRRGVSQLNDHERLVNQKKNVLPCRRQQTTVDDFARHYDTIRSQTCSWIQKNGVVVGAELRGFAVWFGPTVLLFV